MTLIKSLQTLESNSVFSLELEKPSVEKIIELYIKNKKFDTKIEEEYINFILNNTKYINYILKFADFEKIINLLIDKNIIVNYLTKEIIDEFVNYHQNNFIVQKKKNAILLNDKFNMQYNFTIETYKKRLNLVLPECIKNHRFIFGENMIYDICNNDTFKQIKKKKFYWEIYIPEDNYDRKEYTLNVIQDTENDCSIIKHNNINFIIKYRRKSLDKIFNTELFCGDMQNIYASPLGFHKLANLTYEKHEKIYDKEYNDKYVISTMGLIVDKKNYFNINDAKYKKCYLCKNIYNIEHNVIFVEENNDVNSKCFKCFVDNYLAEKENANMTGMTAFITGIRHTIGFSIALKLLRFGCFVIGTSRFPACAIYNYQQEKDYDEWKERLIICQCDFLNIASVQKTINLVKQYKPHIIINNACQTIRPSKEYYERVSMIENNMSEKIHQIKDKQDVKICEETKIMNMSDNLFVNDKWSYIENLPKIETNVIIPVNFTRNICDPNLNQKHNSWTLSLQDVSMTELLEVNAINQIIPTMIIQQLLEHMQIPSFVIQVSAKEGIFDSNKVKENGKHPHTNMCKAGMNMLIRTLSEMKKPNCYFYAVDPGFVSGIFDGLYPLTLNDGAQRVIHPIISHLNGKTLKQGHYKNYNLYKW